MLDFLKSTVGRKYIMGISGLVWMGFVLTHMAGNMLILVSPDLYNAYGHAIVSNKLVLYGAESVLVLALIVHVTTAISLTIENRKAKGTRYAVNPNGDKGPTLASQTMGLQGSLVLAFIITHLATFKYGKEYETVVNGVPMRDLHRLVVELFQQPGYVLWYVVALIVLMFHLSHGAHSIFQSFGFLERKMVKGVRKFAWAYAIIVAAGFLSQPLYVYLLKGN
ncbi:cytochrome B subunit [Bdellovibrio sp. qaytius]|nr:cytochrome B subunit [Bdellovibrio sp. qaytius]